MTPLIETDTDILRLTARSGWTIPNKRVVRRGNLIFAHVVLRPTSSYAAGTSFEPISVDQSNGSYVQGAIGMSNMMTGHVSGNTLWARASAALAANTDTNIMLMVVI